MASPVSRGVTPAFPLKLVVELDGGGTKELSLRLNYDFNASVLVEERTGYNGLNGAIFQNLTAAHLSILLWAMVQANHPEFRNDAGLFYLRSLLTFRNSAEVSEAVQENWIRNLADDQAEKIRAKIAEAKAKAEAGEPPLAPKPTESTPTAA